MMMSFRGRRAAVAHVSGPALLLLSMLVALVGSGCGPRTSGPRRHDVRGSVTYRGEPVPSGVIYFEPDAAQGNKGPVAVVPIVEGRYDTLVHKCPGPLEGPAVVRIVGYSVAKPGAEIVPPLFPEYRSTVTITPAKSGTAIDFDVPSEKKKVP